MNQRLETDASKSELLARIDRQDEIIRELLTKNEELRIRLWLAPPTQLETAGA